MNSNIESQQEFYEMGKQRAANSLIDFSIFTDKNYDPNWHHEVIADSLEAVERGEIDRLIITVPPRHGKSELSTIKFPAWFIGKNPGKSIITSSYSGDLAVNFGRKVRNLIRSQDVFSASLAEDSKSAGIWHTKDGGAYVAAGVGGAITGKGAHVFLIDDPFKNREEAESEVIREKVWDWFTSVVYTRLEEKGAIVLIQTRWHEDDLAGRLLRDNHDNWCCIDLPAIAMEDEKHRKKGEALWPKKYPLPALERIKENVGVYDWSALYQQEPVSKESAEFKDDWFKYYTDYPEDLNVFMTVDPAISKKARADSSVIMMCGLSKDHDIYILDYFAAKLDPGELINKMWSMAEKWQPLTIGIETQAYQQALSYFFKEKMEREDTWYTIEEITQKVDKEQRIRRLIPFYSNGKVYHKKHFTDLENELLKFPSGVHDDIVDSLSMQLDITFKPDIVTIKKESVPYQDDPDAPWNKRAKGKGYNKIYSY